MDTKSGNSTRLLDLGRRKLASSFLEKGRDVQCCSAICQQIFDVEASISHDVVTRLHKIEKATVLGDVSVRCSSTPNLRNICDKALNVFRLLYDEYVNT